MSMNEEIERKFTENKEIQETIKTSEDQFAVEMDVK